MQVAVGTLRLMGRAGQDSVRPRLVALLRRHERANSLWHLSETVPERVPKTNTLFVADRLLQWRS